MAALKRLLLPLLCLALASPALAQAGGGAFIHLVDPSAFPRVTAVVSVTDAAGQFVPDLTASSFAVTENGKPIPELSVTELEAGVQLVIVLNPGDSFRRRDTQGKTRMQYVTDALVGSGGSVAWMANGLDDVSLITPEGPLVSHSDRSADLQTAVLGYETDYAGAESGTALLQQGLAFALDPAPRPGMSRVIVFLSSALESLSEEQLADIVAQAQDRQVAIHTVYVGPTGSQGTQGAQNLQRIAEAGDGSFAFTDFDAAEALAPVLQSLQGQRVKYGLAFRSRAVAAGKQSVTVRVQAGGQTLVAGPAEYSISLQPPAVAFSDLPTRIVRQTDSLTQRVRIEVAFPDMHPRSLSRTVLLVDGQPVADNAAEPFDVFEWDLSGFAETAEHRLQAVAVDELGLQGQSAERAVTVEVPGVAARAIEAAVPDWAQLLALGILGVAVLSGGAALAWRLHAARASAAPPPERVLKPTRRPAPAARSIPWRAKRPSPVTGAQRIGKAYLEFVEGGEGCIEILEPIVRLGRDGSVAQAVFADRSVSRLHARLAEVGDCVFHLVDEGSTSGTWVNYEQVPMAGVQLKDGDLVNLGRVQLRFRLRQGGSPAPVPTATPAPRDDLPTVPALPVKRA